MNKYHKIFLALICILSFANFSTFAADDLDCSGTLSKGNNHTGRFIKLISKDSYERTHYMFKPDNNSNAACVQVAETTTPNRAKQVYNAFVLEQRVTITVENDNYVSGLSITLN